MRPEKSIRLISAFVCTLLLSMLFAACTPGIKSGGGGIPSGTKHKLAFVTNNASDFWIIARKGTEKAQADIPGIEVEFRIPADGTAAEQQRIVDDLSPRASRESRLARSTRQTKRRCSIAPRAKRSS